MYYESTKRYNFGNGEVYKGFSAKNDDRKRLSINSELPDRTHRLGKVTRSF